MTTPQDAIAQRSRMTFVGGIAPGIRAWAGEWPPPDQLYAVKGKLTGDWVFVDPERFQQFIGEVGGYGLAAERFLFERYFRQDTSMINDRQLGQLEGVIRAAEYVPEPD